MDDHQRSVHISYDSADNEKRGKTTRQSIISLVAEAANRSNISMQGLRILDAGCGIGLLMRDLKNEGVENVVGIDFDDRCLDQAATFGAVANVDLKNLRDAFPERDFDVVVLSHVLEHIENPIDFLSQVKSLSRRWIIAACPNPVRPKIVLKYAFRGLDYSNRGHVYSWDRSHFTNFLERYNRLSIVDWATDDIRIVPFRALRRFLDTRGVLEWLEVRLLPKYFPYFSSSLIALCEVPQGKSISF